MSETHDINADRVRAEKKLDEKRAFMRQYALAATRFGMKWDGGGVGTDAASQAAATAAAGRALWDAIEREAAK